MLIASEEAIVPSEVILRCTQHTRRGFNTAANSKGLDQPPCVLSLVKALAIPTHHVWTLSEKAVARLQWFTDWFESLLFTDKLRWMGTLSGEVSLLFSFLLGANSFL